MVFASRKRMFGRGSTGKRPKPRVQRVKPTPQPDKNAPLLDKRLPGLFGQKMTWRSQV